ncbi:hypothetical protein [Tabrizicola caldifontis]|uniref:hypothetical protein n=1 Tax=Tabrizicola caldifontis TaxID=2528036 RepID=UPI001080C332|nr:hypothetical protein [Rhodobacter sp. YIM 73028]
MQMMVKAAEGTTIESGGKQMDLGAVLAEAMAMAPDDPLIVARADALRGEAEARSRGPAIGNTGAAGTATATSGTSVSDPVSEAPHATGRETGRSFDAAWQQLPFARAEIRAD